jgi:hypothetical protein
VNGGSRQRTLLIFLGILLVILAWVRLRPMLGLGGDEQVVPTPRRPAAGAIDEDGGSAPAAPPSGHAAGEHHGARPGDRVSLLRTADLDRVPRLLGVGRDPWRFVDPPPPPPPPPPKPHIPTPEEIAAEEARRRAAEEAARLAAIEAAKPRPPDFTLDYLGNFGPPERKIAVFSDGKDVFPVREGGVINNQFIVAHIGLESVEIRFVGFPDTPAKRVGVRRSRS